MARRKRERNRLRRLKLGRVFRSQPQQGNQDSLVNKLSRNIFDRLKIDANSIYEVNQAERFFGSNFWRDNQGRPGVFLDNFDRDDATMLNQLDSDIDAMRTANQVLTGNNDFPRSILIRVGNTADRQSARARIEELLDLENNRRNDGRQFRISDTATSPMPLAQGQTEADRAQLVTFIIGEASPDVPPGFDLRDLPDKKAFRKAMGEDPKLLGSARYKAIISALEKHNKTLDNYRSAYARAQNDTDRNRLTENATRQLQQDARNLIAAADNYLDNTTTRDDDLTLKDQKREVVTDLKLQVSSTGYTQLRLQAARLGIETAHLINSPLTQLNTGTASDVYLTRTTGNIGTTNTKIGFAKKAVNLGDQANPTTTVLGFPTNLIDVGNEPLTQAPNLLARQVLSSRLDKALQTNVLADEVFSRDTNDNNRLIGITGKVNGKPIKNQTAQFDIYNHIDYTIPAIQKGLSDLQVMDALTGQGDRHLGNIFVDEANGVVKGIDNDMAFPIDQGRPYITTANTLDNQFEVQNGRLVYKQDQIDAQTGARILAMKESDFLKVLQGQPNDPEKLDAKGIENAMARFRAVKARVRELQTADLLISNWGPATYQASLNNGVIDEGTTFERYTNYVAKAQKRFDIAGRDDNPNLQGF